MNHRLRPDKIIVIVTQILSYQDFDYKGISGEVSPEDVLK
jgi:hypothetical protein